MKSLHASDLIFIKILLNFIKILIKNHILQEFYNSLICL